MAFPTFMCVCTFFYSRMYLYGKRVFGILAAFCLSTSSEAKVDSNFIVMSGAHTLKYILLRFQTQTDTSRRAEDSSTHILVKTIRQTHNKGRGKKKVSVRSQQRDIGCVWPLWIQMKSVSLSLFTLHATHTHTSNVKSLRQQQLIGMVSMFARQIHSLLVFRIDSNFFRTHSASCSRFSNSVTLI